jgi:probable HAF family extracellular repeat protein
MKKNILYRAVIALGFLAVPALAQQYNVIDLGLLPNSNPNINPGGTTGVAIDNAGEATGLSDNSVLHGFFWNGTTLSDMDSPSSTQGTIAHGIGPTGTVVGETDSGLAFTWTTGGGFNFLATPAGKIDAAAWGINAAGDVAGQATDSSGTILAATVWRAGGANSLLSPAGAFFFSVGRGINNSRTVVGNSNDDGSSEVATVWNYNSTTDSWTAQSIGTLTGGPDSSALAINNAGNVVGESARTPGNGVGAFIWHPGDTSLTDLDPTDSLGNTQANGINSSNDVVGNIGNRGAFIWDTSDGIVDLQTLLDPSSDFTLTGAAGINDNGDIIATATDSADGLPHAVILQPTPEPASAVIALGGLGYLLLSRRKTAMA